MRAGTYLRGQCILIISSCISSETARLRHVIKYDFERLIGHGITCGVSDCKRCADRIFDGIEGDAQGCRSLGIIEGICA